MKVLEAGELEQLVRDTFPARQISSIVEDLQARGNRPVVGFVHGGPDPFLDHQFDEWLEGAASFVPLYQVLNRLCRAGVLAPGDYAVRASARLA